MNDDGSIGYADLYPLLDEIRAMAHGLLLGEHNAQSLQTTALLLTALKRLKRKDQQWSEVRWKNRKYFFGAAYKAMRRALIDHARARAGQARQARDHYEPVEELKGQRLAEFAAVDPLDTAGLEQLLDERPAAITALMEALETLRERHPDWAEAVEHRYWGGLTIPETARMMEISPETVKRWWRRARVLLLDDVKGRLGAGASA